MCTLKIYRESFKTILYFTILAKLLELSLDTHRNQRWMPWVGKSKLGDLADGGRDWGEECRTWGP